VGALRSLPIRISPVLFENTYGRFEHCIVCSCPAQACRLLLTLPALPDESSGLKEGVGRGYDQLVSALVSLMSVGTEYTNQTKKQAEQVLLGTASHQCFSLSMSLLGALPPSYRVLSAMVEGDGLSLMVSEELDGSE
jgi:hypothetical protein